MWPRVLVSLLLAITVLLLTRPAAAAVSARLDRDRIGIDESVNLTVTAEGVMNTFKSLDTEPLKKDFTILNQSTGSSFRIINGKTTSSKTWSLELEAKRAGTLTIPPLTIGGEQTAPLTLVVSPNPPGSAGPGKPGAAFLEIVPESSTPAYLQSQVTVTVRLFLQAGLHLSNASLEEPDLERARVIRLGGDVRYTTRRGNTTYQVIERKYAIIPEEGTEITIPPLRFQAVAGSGNFPGDPFFDRFTGRARRIGARSHELKIRILPIPPGYTGRHWLPARQLLLTENGGKNKKQVTLKVGEPLTREIVISARGLTAEQLPELDFKAPGGGKVYADKAQRQTRTGRDGLEATLRQSVAFIPEKPGTFILPEIRLKWWDLVNDREAVAVLPARTVRVVGSSTTASSPNGSNPAAGSPSAPAAAPESINPGNPAPAGHDREQTEGEKHERQLRLWQGIALFMGLAWLLTLVLFWRARRQKIPAAKAENRPPQRDRNRADLDKVKHSCRANDPGATQRALLDWASSAWPENPPANLAGVAARLNDPELEKRFFALEKVLYSPAGDHGWQGEEFWLAIKPRLAGVAAGTVPKRSGHQADRLPPLYPESRK